RGIGRRQVQLVRHRTVAFEQRRQLAYRLLAGVGAELDRPVGVLAVIGMVLLDQGVALGRRELRYGLGAARVPALMDQVLEGLKLHYLMAAQTSLSCCSSMPRTRSHSAWYLPCAISSIRSCRRRGFSEKKAPCARLEYNATRFGAISAMQTGTQRPHITQS